MEIAQCYRRRSKMLWKEELSLSVLSYLRFSLPSLVMARITVKDIVIIELSSLETTPREEFRVWITEHKTTGERRVCAGSTPSVPLCLDPCSLETGNLWCVPFFVGEKQKAQPENGSMVIFHCLRAVMKALGFFVRQCCPTKKDPKPIESRSGNYIKADM